MTHDPLCEWRPCTCPLDYDVPERGHMIGCPEDDCECEIIAKVREDTLDSVINLLEEMNSQRVWWNDMLTWCISVNEAISQIDNIRWEKEEV